MIKNSILILTLCVLCTYMYAAERPLLKELMGLNGHTFQIDPAVYEPVADNLRDFHPMDWDVDGKPGQGTIFPVSRKHMHKGKQINWAELYGAWKKHGNTVNVSLMTSYTKKQGNWGDMEKEAYAYAKAFAAAFGPSSKTPVVDSVEIGNEPVPYSTEEYMQLFKAMAKGVRDGDPKMKIVTCTSSAEEPDQYEKPLQAFKDHADLFDVINLHSYGFVEGYPTWERSYPEDPNVRYLTMMESAIAYRNKYHPDKPIWLTEFGYDSCSQGALKKKRKKHMEKWLPCSETEQGQWIVRSFLVFSAMDLDRAYLYFFDDRDTPSFHSASGITRNGKPKPSFYAMAHLRKTLGEYRFHRAVQKTVGDAYVYEYKSNAGELIWVAWSPTKGKENRSFSLKDLPGSIASIERMPLAAGPAENVAFKAGKSVDIPLGESPLFIRFK